jgi:hypothetical protein
LSVLSDKVARDLYLEIGTLSNSQSQTRIWRAGDQEQATLILTCHW